MIKTIHIIVNPFSGTFPKHDFKEQVVKRYPNHTHVQVFYSEYAGHAALLAKQAVEQGVDQVFALGGDGTVNEIASALVHSKVVLGILPGGSGNGFAMHIGMGRDVWKALDILLLRSKTKTIDTLKVNDVFCLNLFGVGFDAQVAYYLKNQKSRGLWLYVKTTLSQLGSLNYLPLQIEIEDKVRKSIYLLAVVANGSSYGFHFTMAPKSRLDDGLLDLVIIRKDKFYKYLLALFKVLSKQIHRSKLVEYIQTPQVKIKALQDGFWHMDGEGFELKAQQEVCIQVVPSSLQILVEK